MALDTFDVVMIDIWFVHLRADSWRLSLTVYLFVRVRLLPVCSLFSGSELA